MQAECFTSTDTGLLLRRHLAAQHCRANTEVRGCGEGNPLVTGSQVFPNNAVNAVGQPAARLAVVPVGVQPSAFAGDVAGAAAAPAAACRHSPAGG